MMTRCLESETRGRKLLFFSRHEVGPTCDYAGKATSVSAAHSGKEIYYMLSSLDLLISLLETCEAKGIVKLEQDGLKIIITPNQEIPSKKIKPKGAVVEFEEFKAYLQNVSQELQLHWLETYRDVDAIKNKIRDLIRWELANPQKAKKNKGAFINNCLGRDLKPANVLDSAMKVKNDDWL